MERNKVSPAPLGLVLVVPNPNPNNFSDVGHTIKLRTCALSCTYSMLQLDFIRRLLL